MWCILGIGIYVAIQIGLHTTRRDLRLPQLPSCRTLLLSLLFVFLELFQLQLLLLFQLLGLLVKLLRLQQLLGIRLIHKSCSVHRLATLWASTSI